MTDQRRSVLLAHGRELRVQVDDGTAVVTALDPGDGQFVVREHANLVEALTSLAAEPSVMSGDWRRAFIGNREELDREAAIAGTWDCRGEVV
jgi:hypothetical protein